MPGVVDMGGEHIRPEAVQWDTWLCSWNEDLGPNFGPRGSIVLIDHWDGRVVVGIIAGQRSWVRAYVSEGAAREAVGRYLASSPRRWEYNPKPHPHRAEVNRWRPEWGGIPAGNPEAEFWRTARRQQRR